MYQYLEHLDPLNGLSVDRKGDLGRPVHEILVRVISGKTALLLSKDGRIKEDCWCTNGRHDCLAKLEGHNSTSSYNLDDLL